MTSGLKLSHLWRGNDEWGWECASRVVRGHVTRMQQQVSCVQLLSGITLATTREWSKWVNGY
jgi:hypothetical protein